MCILGSGDLIIERRQPHDLFSCMRRHVGGIFTACAVASQHIKRRVFFGGLFETCRNGSWLSSMWVYNIVARVTYVNRRAIELDAAVGATVATHADSVVFAPILRPFQTSAARAGEAT